MREYSHEKVKRVIKANTYYYEERNIRFNLKIEFNERVNSGSDGSLTLEIMKVFEKRKMMFI